MPAEWEPHAATLMAWPTTTRCEFWSGAWHQAMAEYAGLANAIAAFEPVVMAVTPEQALTARRRLTRGVELLEVELDDSWLRDCGPIVVREADGLRTGIHFRFNSWGGKYLPFDRDAAVAGPLLEHLGIRREVSPMVLEGGSITVDGEGTLITTEQCLLNSNRNPELTREQIAAELRARLGVETIVWLPYGHFYDRDTDGHVDGVATFVGPGRVAVQTCEDAGHPDHERMQANLAVLGASRDARGRPFDVVEIPQYAPGEVDGQAVSVPYLNVYFANGALIVPVGGHANDDQVLALMAEVAPGRDVIGVPAAAIAFGGGGPHCVTQQVPAEEFA
ncbi:MAG: agmatine deiminase family protein [Solirubrobacterales bacterium]